MTFNWSIRQQHQALSHMRNNTVIEFCIFNILEPNVNMFRLDDLLNKTEFGGTVYCDVHGGMVKISALVSVELMVIMIWL
jgi:hypothetical protein